MPALGRPLHPLISRSPPTGEGEPQPFIVQKSDGGFMYSTTDLAALSQRSADSFGAASVEEIKGGPPALIAPVLMVLLIAKNPGTFAFLPTFAGFSVERLATVAQVFYPSDFGLEREEAAGAVAGARAAEE